jgi:hypothetical protein
MGLVFIAFCIVLVAMSVLLMPGWKSFLTVVGLYAAAILWLTYSGSPSSGEGCKDTGCGGAMAGYLLGWFFQRAAWGLLAVLTIVKFMMLTMRSRN